MKEIASSLLAYIDLFRSKIISTSAYLKTQFDLLSNKHDIFKLISITSIIIVMMVSYGLLRYLKRKCHTYSFHIKPFPIVIFKRSFSTTVVTSFLGLALKKSIDILILALQYGVLYKGVFFILNQFHFSFFDKSILWFRLGLVNVFILTLYYQLFIWLKRNQYSLILSIRRLSFHRIKTLFIVRSIKSILIFFASLTRFVVTVPLLWFYLEFLEDNVALLASTSLTQRFNGCVILLIFFLFRKTYISLYHECSRGFRYVSTYITFPIKLHRITIIRKDQLHFLIFSLFKGLLFSSFLFLTFLIIRYSFLLISIGLLPQNITTITTLITNGITLYLIWRFYRWFRASTAPLKKESPLFSRVLKLLLHIDRKSPLNRIHFTPFIETALTLFNIIVLGLTVYVAFGVILKLFPGTQQLSELVFGHIMIPLSKGSSAIINFLPNLFIIGIVIAISNYVMDFSRFFFREIEDGNIRFNGFYPEFAMPTYKIVRFLITIFSIIIIFPYLPGSQSPAFKGISVFLGILFSLGSSSAVSNIIAGIMITYMRPFKVGDRVKIADTIGDIVEKGLLVTRIKTIKNIYIAIPNSLILGTHITNFSFMNNEVPVIINSKITIGYDVPWKTVHDLLIKSARNTSHILQEPAPFVFQTNLSDFYVEYEINAFTTDVNQMSIIYSELHQHIQDEFAKHNVEIMSPHYRVIRSSNESTIPKNSPPTT